jgi:phosphoribosyl 1,2-cyclic phosphodiesterase
MRKIPGMKIACSEGTFLSMRARSYPDRFIQAKSGEPMQIGRITAIPLTLSHDVGDPVGFSFAAEGGQVTIITDTGTYTQEMLDHAAKSDILVIEANHDVAMLKNGRYPPFLKQRIISDKGHLSNAQTARFIIEAMEIDPKPRCILLAHLSADNNTPAIAMKTVSDALAKEGLYSGKDLYLSVLERDKISPIYQI